jgi:UDP-N-acetyl-D-glucosamine dehydrogenase
MINSGESFTGDVTADEIRAALASGRYRASTALDDVANFDVAVITVPTPLHEGIPNLRLIEESAAGLANYLTPGATVILESTTYPGTTDELMVPILENGSGLKAGVDFLVGYSPERIDPGNTKWNFISTPKVVSGIDKASLDAVSTFYGAMIDRVVPVSSTQVAEMTKLLENTFRHVNIALVNELAMFAHEMGVNVWEAIEAASSKPFGFMPFTPGPGVGGHCLPIDPSYLSWKAERVTGRAFRFVELANDVNRQMPNYVTTRVSALLNSERKAVNGSRILILGVAYKKNTADSRESPSIEVCEALAELGADVRVVDDMIPTTTVLPWTRVSATEEECRRADITVLLTDHDSVDYQMVAATSPLVFDARRRTAASDTVHHL